MAHCNNGGCKRPEKETQVTPRKRNFVVSIGVSATGVALSAGIITGAIKPDEATALATVIGTTITSAVLLTRRPPSPDPVDTDQGGAMSLEK